MIFIKAHGFSLLVLSLNLANAFHLQICFIEIFQILFSKFFIHKPNGSLLGQIPNHQFPPNSLFSLFVLFFLQQKNNSISCFFQIYKMTYVMFSLHTTSCGHVNCEFCCWKAKTETL